MDLKTTLIILFVELVLLGICYWQVRKPTAPGKPGKPRLIPYRLIMLTLVVIALTTVAHVIALVTGNPVVPRTQKYGN